MARPPAPAAGRAARSRRRPMVLLWVLWAAALALACLTVWAATSRRPLSALVPLDPDTVPATIGGRAERCEDIAVRVASSSLLGRCQVVSHSHDFQVERCLAPRTEGNGTFVISTTYRPAENPVYRVRLLGPEILVAPVYYCGNLTAAVFSVALPGVYHVEVLRLYSNFSYSAPPPIDPNLAFASFWVSIKKGLPRPPPCRGAQCPLCTSPRAAAGGRWLVQPQAFGLVLSALKHTCVTETIDRGPCGYDMKLLAQNESFREVAFQPLGCSFRPPGPGLAKACLRSRACFIGDSQMRTLHNQYVKIMDKARGAPDDFARRTAANATLNSTGGKEVRASFYSEYRLDRFGDLRADVSNCTHVFASFGSWPLSRMVVNPWPLGAFRRRVDSVGRFLARQKARHHIQVYWVTINPHALMRHMHGDGSTPGDNWSRETREVLNKHGMPLDWRTDPFVLRYNLHASAVMARHGIPTVDLHSVADALPDAAYDGSHFGGIVGVAQVAAVTPLLCDA